MGSYSKFRLLAEEVHNSTFDILCVTETKLTRVGMEMTSLIAHQLGLKVVHSHPRSPGGRGSLIIWKPHCDLIQGSTHTDSQSRLVVQKFHLPGKNKSLTISSNYLEDNHLQREMKLAHFDTLNSLAPTPYCLSLC